MKNIILHIAPNAHPAKTSSGKWAPQYILEYPTSRESGINSHAAQENIKLKEMAKAIVFEAWFEGNDFLP